MKERLVRGTNLASVLRVLRSERRSRPLPELGAWEQDLLRRTVAPSTWYSLKVFDSLLQLVHRFVFDGSEIAAQRMGRSHARAQLTEGRIPLVVAGDPLESIAQLPARWREQFNFGQLQILPLPAREGSSGVRIRISGYPDMSACHGHTIVGFTLELCEEAGALEPQVSIEERPWMHNSVLSYTVSWRER